ncbi:Uncharacterised protein [Cedecea neteri]|uniref:Uncharacterized protein n=1 Tax=Cedecea neteri TaxID=158822 RepID=A0A2X2TBW2_9ENTR|nr:Uncharacterised protein [Cedecea neteri]
MGLVEVKLQNVIFDVLNSACAGPEGVSLRDETNNLTCSMKSPDAESKKPAIGGFF